MRFVSGHAFQACRSRPEGSRLQPLQVSIPVRHSNPVNIVVPQPTFFVTSSIAQKRSLLQSERSAQLFEQVLYEYRRQGKFQLHEFVIMPDHFHILLTVDGSLAVERAVQVLKGGFAFRAGRELGFRAPVWQKGFSEVRVRDWQAFDEIRKYIWNNPVARHLVREAAEFPHSSAHLGFELDPAPQGLKPRSLSES